MSTTTIDRIRGINSGVAIKAPCRVATTANIALSGEQTIDGVAIVAGDRVLVRSQTSGVDNGIYVAATSSWSRDLDFNGSRDVVTGTLVSITFGTLYAGTIWEVTAVGDIMPGTTSITFTQRIGTIAGVTPFMSTLLDDVDAATARTTLGAASSASLASYLSLAGGTMTGGLTMSGANITLTPQVTVATTGGNTWDIGSAAGNNILTSGGGAITSLGTAPAGIHKYVRLGSINGIVHNATSLILPTGATITPTAANDFFLAISLGSGNWYVPFYVKANGYALKNSTIVSSAVYATNTTLTTTIPLDDTIPQNTEGTEILSLAYTPINSNSKLTIKVETWASIATTGQSLIAALFVDTTANALRAAARTNLSNATMEHVHFEHEVTAGSTTARTYKVRLGASSGDCYPNGLNGTTRYFGGVLNCRLTVTEITP